MKYGRKIGITEIRPGEQLFFGFSHNRIFQGMRNQGFFSAFGRTIVQTGVHCEGHQDGRKETFQSGDIHPYDLFRMLCVQSSGVSGDPDGSKHFRRGVSAQAGRHPDPRVGDAVFLLPVGGDRLCRTIGGKIRPLRPAARRCRISDRLWNRILSAMVGGQSSRPTGLCNQLCSRRQPGQANGSAVCFPIMSSKPWISMRLHYRRKNGEK